MNLTLLQAAAAQPNGMFGGTWGTLIMMVVLILIFWLFFIRPQSKRQKELARAREAMKEGDRVVTSGGLHGKIVKVEATTFLVEVDKDVRIQIEKSAVFASGQEANNNK